ncbi:MAG: 1-acyl-sn-glycerol-3-phosphate acyltransferase, partial [Flavobacteriaceae bacterium]|nr:1-acyl-sn-glycerol-3-phosphate acyltransferase [Flavobacteriaceae bacterium]
MKTLLHLLSYPLTLIFYLCFGLCIVIFHPIQWICFNVFGYKAHQHSVAWLNWWLMRCLNILGARFTVNLPKNLPENAPIIIVSNHQSMWDIPPIIWYMRK